MYQKHIAKKMSHPKMSLLQNKGEAIAEDSETDKNKEPPKNY